MELSSRESIRFFRLWDQPRTMLAWEDVKTRCPSWKSLHQDYSFTREKLFSLQPNKVEWIKRGALTLHDMTDMSHFPINPISDLHADLAEVWLMHWTAEEMKLMGITYAQMKRSGLNSRVMQHFGFSLLAWSSLQFDGRDVEQMPDSECQALFGLPQGEVCNIFACSYVP